MEREDHPMENFLIQMLNQKKERIAKAKKRSVAQVLTDIT